LKIIDSPYGKCRYCKNIFEKSIIKDHIHSCEERKAVLEKKEMRKCFHILVTGYGYYGVYWLHLEVPLRATLKYLDFELREIWLECCGHLSAFTIGGVRYASCPDDEFGLKEKAMNITLGKVLKENKQFTYEYDYGTTTDLELTVLEEYEGGSKGSIITLLARNEPPDLICSHCDAKAEYICSECFFNETGLKCEKCCKNEEHECGIKMSLPVVNSPRTGTCGYTGDKYWL
jgi:hypothetical protein